MPLLSELVQFVCDQAEAALQLKFPQDERLARLTNASAHDDPASDDSIKIAMIIVSMQENANVGRFQSPVRGPGDDYSVLQPALHIDLYFAFASFLSGMNYTAGIGMLSTIMAHFQENPVFDQAMLPQMGERNERLYVDFVSLDFAQAAHVASLIGLHGQPFVTYRLRRLTFEGTVPQKIVPPVRHVPLPKL